MHAYLPAIGFSKLNKYELADLLARAQAVPDSQEFTIDNEGNQFVELKYMVSEELGLCLRGTMDNEDEFVLDYYFPIFIGSSDSSHGEVEIIKQSDKESYQVMCDEIKLGVNLIFHLQNMCEFLSVSGGVNSGETDGVSLVGLCNEGTIILPILKTEANKEAAFLRQQRRNNLVESAREGDEFAIENLTIDDMDLYTMISRRIHSEDILSIVTTYFMPFGIENDKYSILGDIKSVKKVYNHFSMEEVYIMTVETNDVLVDVCVNGSKLLGEPAVGRRFKGNVWLQGNVQFL